MGAANRQRGEEFAEALYEEGLEAGFLDPAGLDLAAGDLLGSTTHISVLDGDGMCASVTCSNGSGSGVLVPGTGVILNNMLGEEDLNPLGFHRIAPGRRVPSMMAPTVVLRDGEIVLGLGSAGSNRIRSAILQTVVRAVEQGLPVDGGGRGAAPALRGGRRPGRARDRRGGAGPARGPRPRRRPPSRDQPLLRRRPGRRPRSRTAAPSAAAATRAAAAPSPTPDLALLFRIATQKREPGENGGRGRHPEIDFEAEGLLDGLDGDAREARLALLRELAADGVSLEELRDAVAAGRLTLLPVERALAGDGPRYTPREVAEIAGIDLELLQRFSAALGVPYTDPDEPRGTEADLEAARRMKAFRDAGLPEEGMLQVARTIGMGTARIAEANRELVIRTLAQPGDSERDLALRFAAAAEFMMPLVGPTLVHALQANMLEQIRRDVIATADLASGGVGGTADLTVCFADLVEFTRLGEEIAPEELGMVAGRLEEMASAVAEPPVRLVKTIGDAVMFVSTEPEPMLSAALALIAAAEAEGEEFPWLRAGLACGPVLPQSGDYYGRPVNLASRITGVARPGSVVVDAAIKEAAGDGFAYTFIGERRLKGIDSKVKLFRARLERG